MFLLFAFWVPRVFMTFPRSTFLLSYYESRISTSGAHASFYFNLVGKFFRQELAIRPLTNDEISLGYFVWGRKYGTWYILSSSPTSLVIFLTSFTFTSAHTKPSFPPANWILLHKGRRRIVLIYPILIQPCFLNRYLIRASAFRTSIHHSLQGTRNVRLDTW